MEDGTADRVVRTVNDVQSELDRITKADLSERLRAVEDDGDLALLVAAVNRSLDRLEYTVRQQTQFASDASHELRSPLTAIRSEIESALMYPAEADLVETLRAVAGGVDRLESLVADLLLLTRISDPSTAAVGRVDLGELVAAEIRLQQDRPGPTDRPVTFEADLEPGVLVEGVDTRLSRAVANILDNAQRHAQSTVTITLHRSGPHAVLTIGDDGDGIPAPDRDRVFDRFTRLDTARDRQSGGTGLGLAIAHNVAASHNGELSVQDAPCPGANLVLILPAAPRPPLT